MATGVNGEGLARGIVESSEGDRLVLALPHSDYRLRLRRGGADAAAIPAGTRVSGTIEARALRIHPAGGGGQFIEPVIGEPRILAGTVRSIERAAGRILVEAAVPMWLVTRPDQDFEVLTEGGLVNCYVESGATFTPVG